MARLISCLLAALLLASVTGCETTPPPPSEASQRGLTTLPWNRPAQWEGGGVLGSQINSMRGN